MNLLEVDVMLENLLFLPNLVNVGGDGTSWSVLHRVGSPPGQEVLDFFPQVLVDHKDDDGDQSEVDVTEPDHHHVLLAQPVLLDLRDLSN